MSIQSNEKLASLAISISHDVWDGGCIVCGKHPAEHHEILKRQMRETLGAAVCILGATLAPLCPIHHAEWSKLSIEKQIDMLHGHFMADMALQHAQRDQLIALKARAAVCK